MDTTPERWRLLEAYMRDTFGAEDEVSQRIAARAAEAGLPDISIGPEVGRLLQILAGLAASGAGDRPPLGLEIGTLAGYSAMWLARGLGERGRLVSFEIDPEHARIARRNLADVGLDGRVEVRLGDSSDLLPAFAAEIEPGALDVVFFDGEKSAYEREFGVVAPLLRVGGLLIVDNALGSNSWSMADPPGSSETREAVDRLNRKIASDSGFVSVALPLRQGVLVARKTAAS